MWNDLCAEQMKYRHTFLGKAFFVAPLLTLLLGIKLSPAYVVLTSFNWWYMFLLPAMLSIVSCSCGEKDRKLGEKAVFTLPVSLKRVRLIKIFYCSLWLFLACIVQCILTFVAGQVFQAKYSDTITIFHALFAGVLLFLTYAWQIPLCLLLEQKCGTVATILINMVANIILSANFCNRKDVADSICSSGASDVSGTKNIAKWASGRAGKHHIFPATSVMGKYFAGTCSHLPMLCCCHRN